MRIAQYLRFMIGSYFVYKQNDIPTTASAYALQTQTFVFVIPTSKYTTLNRNVEWQKLS